MKIHTQIFNFGTWYNSLSFQSFEELQDYYKDYQSNIPLNSFRVYNLTLRKDVRNPNNFEKNIVLRVNEAQI